MVESREAYVAARREAEQTIKRAKAEQWSEIGDKLRDDIGINKNMLYGLAKSYRKEKSKQYNIKDEIGNVITTLRK